MNQARYHIRPAQPTDLPALRVIEQAAAQLFGATQYDFIVHDEGMSLAAYEHHFTHNRIWVAADENDTPVGFAVARLLDGNVYLHEIDVHPDHGRRGLGRQLIAAVIEWARQQQMPAVTLSTFDNIAWNAPYYAKLGFQPLPQEALSPGLQEVRRREAANGLDSNHRVCMILFLP